MWNVRNASVDLQMDFVLVEMSSGILGRMISFSGGRKQEAPAIQYGVLDSKINVLRALGSKSKTTPIRTIQVEEDGC